ncbi:MAG TPA: hypothetical protein VGP84_21120 [Gemmatimonadaceae bacterium]|nr:hypothetical protein [Gemmatimonadaceae bacterium]
MTVDQLEDSYMAQDVLPPTRAARRPEIVQRFASPAKVVSGVEATARIPLTVAILAGVIVAEVWRQGAFYTRDAFVVALVATGLVARELVAGIDRRAKRAAQAIALCTLWWLFVAFLHGRGKTFLPLGASMIGFLAGFLVVRRLDREQRTRVAQAIATIGAAAAAIGLEASVTRRFPLAMPAQNLWRLSTTLTYADAAGLLVGIALLIAVSLDAKKWLTRVDVYLCTAGLVATQSRGAVLAVAVGAVAVPLAASRRALRPLVIGAIGGLIVVATSSGPATHPFAGVALLVGVVVAAYARPPSDISRVVITRRNLSTAVVVGAACAICALVVLRTPIQRRVELASTNDRVVEWTAAFRQWESSPLVGVGPDRILRFHA